MLSPKTSLSLRLQEAEQLAMNPEPSQVADMIQDLREMIPNDQKLSYRTDDAFLLRFLRARRFNLKRAYDLLVNFYTQRANNPHFFKKSLSELETALSSNYQGVLSKRDVNGSAICIFNSIFHWNPSEFSLEDIASNTVWSLERLVQDEDVQINGAIILIDMKGLNYSHLLSLNPLTIKRVLDAVVNSFPIRFRTIHFVNEPYLFYTLFMILRPLITEKLLGRMKFHGSTMESLHEYVSPDILPEEFGGHNGPYDNSIWNQKLKMHETSVTKI